jgi:hypothetical protein
VNVRTHRTKFLTGIAATCLALTSSIGPSFAQSGPVLGSWLAGPDGKGSSTIVGRIETPRSRATVNNAANLLVSGWAADTTASGWAGIDGVEVWSGASDKSGSTKLATGIVGLARTDVGEALGGSFTNSGFSAVVKSGALQGLKGAQTLFVYLHTPGKGTWYRSSAVNVISTVGVNSATGATLDFPSDPILVIARPQDGMAITQKQRNGKFSFNGIALDRNTITDPNIQLTGPGCSGCAGARGAIGTQARGSGVGSILAYIDTPPVKGDQSVFGLFGTPCAAACLYANILVNNGGTFNAPGTPAGSIISRNYGGQFDFSGWSIPINPSLLSVGPHTLFVTATSSVTGSLNANNQFVGKQTTASVSFNIISSSHIQPDPLVCTGVSKAQGFNSNC